MNRVQTQVSAARTPETIGEILLKNEGAEFGQRLADKARSTMVDMLYGFVSNMVQGFSTTPQNTRIEPPPFVPVKELGIAIQNRLLESEGQKFIPIRVPQDTGEKGYDHTKAEMISQLRAIYQHYKIKGYDEVFDSLCCQNMFDFYCKVANLLNEAVRLLSETNEESSPSNSPQLVFITQGDEKQNQALFTRYFNQNGDEENQSESAAKNNFAIICIQDPMKSTSDNRSDDFVPTIYEKVIDRSSFEGLSFSDWRKKIVADFDESEITITNEILDMVSYICRGDPKAILAVLDSMEDIFPHLYIRINKRPLLHRKYGLSAEDYNSLDSEEINLVQRLYEKYFLKEVAHIDELVKYLEQKGFGNWILDASDGSEDFSPYFSHKDLLYLYSIASQFVGIGDFEDNSTIVVLISEILAKAFNFRYKFRTDGRGFTLDEITQFAQAILGFALNKERDYSPEHRDTLLEAIPNYFYEILTWYFSELKPVISILNSTAIKYLEAYLSNFIENPDSMFGEGPFDVTSAKASRSILNRLLQFWHLCSCGIAEIRDNHSRSLLNNTSEMEKLRQLVDLVIYIIQTRLRPRE